MTASLEAAAEGPDKLAFLVKDKDGGVVFLAGMPFMDDVKQSLCINGNVVCGLPGKVVG